MLHLRDVVQSKTIEDPLGNQVHLIPLKIMNGSSFLLSDVYDVVQHPRFIIRIDSERIYYFKPLSLDLNLIVEAEYGREVLTMKGYATNPEPSFISLLLKRGELISYLQ